MSPVKRGQRKHLWSPGRWKSAEVSTCDGCGAQIQRVRVLALTAVEGMRARKVHKIYVHRYRASATVGWDLVWDVPGCPRVGP